MTLSMVWPGGTATYVSTSPEMGNEELMNVPLHGPSWRCAARQDLPQWEVAA
jgi:hypothetical protein